MMIHNFAYYVMLCGKEERIKVLNSFVVEAYWAEESRRRITDELRKGFIICDRCLNHPNFIYSRYRQKLNKFLV